MFKLKYHTSQYLKWHFGGWGIYGFLFLSHNLLTQHYAEEKYLEICLVTLWCYLLFSLATHRLGIIYQKKEWFKTHILKQFFRLFSASLVISIINIVGVVVTEIISFYITGDLIMKNNVIHIDDRPDTLKEITIWYVGRLRWPISISNIINHWSFLSLWSVIYINIQDRILTGRIEIRVKDTNNNKTWTYLKDVYFVRSKTDRQGNSTGKQVEIYTKDSTYIYQTSITGFEKKYERYQYYKCFQHANRRLYDDEKQKQSAQVRINRKKCKYNKETPDRVFFQRDKDETEKNTILLSEDQQKELIEFIGKTT